MTTGLDIAKKGLKTAGVIGLGMQPLAEDTNDAFNALNNMISEWQLKKFLVYHLVDSSVMSTGALSYSVGVGGNINLPWRPDRIEAAYIRQFPTGGNAVDTPMRVLEAREDYAMIQNKTLQGFPYVIWYDADFPLGHIFPYPVPTTGLYETHILTKGVLARFANPAAVYTFPPEYLAALEFNLANRIRVGYRMGEDPHLSKMCSASLRTIRGANAQIKRLTIPDELAGRGGRYDVLTDQTT